MDFAFQPTTFPASLQLARAELTAIQWGCSDSGVWHVRWPDDSQAYLKVQAIGSPEPFSRDVAIHRWLHPQMSVPVVLDHCADQTREYLLLAAIPGLPASEDAFREHPERLVQTLAESLLQLHALSLENCPFELGLDLKLAQAQQHLSAGRVDPDDFEPCHVGRSPEQLLAQLFATRPSLEGRVFTHGDACLPNFILAPDLRLNGMIDLGRAGIASPWQDLALVLRSLAHNAYPIQVQQAFLAAYGAEWVPELYDYYVLLDEFF